MELWRRAVGVAMWRHGTKEFWRLGTIVAMGRHRRHGEAVSGSKLRAEHSRSANKIKGTAG